MRYIDGDALYDRFQNLAYDDWNQGTGTTWANAFAESADVVDDMPTEDVAPIRHGKWTIGERTNVYGGREITCSECGESFMVSPLTLKFLSDTERYCCRCGAKMDGDKG